MRLALITLLLVCAPCQAADVEIADRDSAGLIRALQQAAEAPGPQRILLHPRGLYTLSLGDSEGLALPPLRGRLSIEGRGAEIRGWGRRPLHFLRVEVGAEATLRDLTLAEAGDGVIRNQGRLRLERVVVCDSQARGETAILWNRGEMVLIDSRIEYNLVHAPGGSATLLRNAGVLDLRDSSLTGNRISHTQPAPLQASALWNLGELRAESVQLRDNLLHDLFAAGELPALTNLAGGRLSGTLAAP